MQKRRDVFLFILLVAVNVAFYHLTSALVTDELLFEDIAKNLGSEQASADIGKRSTFGFKILTYVFHLIWVIIKILGVSFLFTVGLNAFNIRTSFNLVLSFSIPPFFIFSLPDLLKVIWFSLLQIDYSLSDLNDFPGFTVSDVLIMSNLVSHGSLFAKLISVISVDNILFCYFFANTAHFPNASSAAIYKASFCSFFVAIFALRLSLLLLTSVIMS